MNADRKEEREERSGKISIAFGGKGSRWYGRSYMRLDAAGSDGN